jgi:hypothetical protein
MGVRVDETGRNRQSGAINLLCISGSIKDTDPGDSPSFQMN